MAPMARTGEAGGALERGRDAYAARAWGDAYALLQRADELESLAPPDLGLLATAAYMLGRDEDWVAAHERAHHLHLESGEVEQAARAAFWIGLSFALRDELGQAEGWFGRAQRLLEERAPTASNRVSSSSPTLSASSTAATQRRRDPSPRMPPLWRDASQIATCSRSRYSCRGRPRQ